ncbi:MAG: hypothetical protein ACREVI_11135 [Steroidobacteraceae bacterium]
MSSRKKKKNDKDLPESLQMFRYFVDLRNLRDGSTLTLRLRTMVKFYLPAKKSKAPRPREEFLQVEDGAVTLETKTFNELVTQLRNKYPDGEYVRTLRRERDHEAERAMDDLMGIIARSALEKYMRDQSGRTDSAG